MTLPYLPDDCIYHILQHLQNDHSTLFNCLLTNRFWCKSTIPLLYANPFIIPTSEKNCSIILTLIYCFNKAEILQLKNQLGPNRINNINLDEEYKPLFEYLKYLEIYNHHTIDTIIIKCMLKYFSGPSVFSKDIYDIISIFHRSILRQSKNIKQLDISSYIFYKESYKTFDVQNFTSNLTKLNSLSFNIYKSGNGIEQEFLSNIVNNCLNLRKLIIKFPQRYETFNHFVTFEKLCTIIQELNKLEIFKIANCYSLLNNVLWSLEFQKNSLVSIEFTNTNFSNVSLKNFNNLYNLKYLSFKYCKGILLNQCEILKFASFKLKELSIVSNVINSDWSVDITSLMIKYLGESLQRLIIENPTVLLIENILMYCPNLILLKISIKFHIDLSFLSLFRNLKTRMLNVSIFSQNTKLGEDLANNIPINISKISIYYHDPNPNRFLLFKEFLENCHNKFEIINLNYIIDLKFLKVVLNYIEGSNNSLKILGVTKLDKNLNDEESKLLNRIKAKGIKIMEFNSIHDIYIYKDI
ncbi:hypothetical protein RhiirA1_465973 [Rhizophagus irregularis]|uniref:F-box domain-containing protein n=1 Tax=Rhizophagus irregularis TaxID=588596 RepID=A0A2N0REW9_9GLOM|nr:hypothetical protein RhiirA1_465973 [Rhizophagus irregularis]